jgi:hypothetical protein
MIGLRERALAHKALLLMCQANVVYVRGALDGA